MATSKGKAAKRSDAAEKHARNTKKFTAEEAERKFKALPPVDRGRFEEVIRRLVTTPAKTKRS